MRGLPLLLLVVLGLALGPTVAAQSQSATPAAAPADAVVGALLGREWRGTADGYGASGASDAVPVRLAFASREGRVLSGTQEVLQPDGSTATERIEVAVRADGQIAGTTTSGLLFGELVGTTLVVALVQSGTGPSAHLAPLRADQAADARPVADAASLAGSWSGQTAGVEGDALVSGDARLDVTETSGGAFRANLAYQHGSGDASISGGPVAGVMLPGGMVVAGHERGVLLGHRAGAGDLVMADLLVGGDPVALRLDLAPEGVSITPAAAAPDLAARWVGPATAASGGQVDVGVDEFVFDPVGRGEFVATHGWQGEDGAWNDAEPLAVVALDDTAAAMVDDTAWHLARLLPDGRLEIVKLLPGPTAPEVVLIEAARQP